MSIKKEIIKSLELQKEIFGDELFEKAASNDKRRTTVYQVNPDMKQVRPNEVNHEKIEIKRHTASLSAGFPLSAHSSGSDVSISVASSVSADSPELVNISSLQELNDAICTCLKCPLGKTRNKFVFGSGNADADVLVLGEGPGKDEDEQGLPFVGRAGKLLTDILAAIQFSREEVYIANIVKCRPPGNRVPLPTEMESCIPYLKKQIELIKPKLILCLGLTAAQGLLRKKDSLGNFRGKVFDFQNIKVMVTYHPAALLRNPAWKRDCWEDVKAFRKLYEQLTGSK